MTLAALLITDHADSERSVGASELSSDADQQERDDPGAEGRGSLHDTLDRIDTKSSVVLRIAGFLMGLVGVSLFVKEENLSQLQTKLIRFMSLSLVLVFACGCFILWVNSRRTSKLLGNRLFVYRIMIAALGLAILLLAFAILESAWTESRESRLLLLTLVAIISLALIASMVPVKLWRMGIRERSWAIVPIAGGTTFYFCILALTYPGLLVSTMSFLILAVVLVITLIYVTWKFQQRLPPFGGAAFVMLASIVAFGGHAVVTRQFLPLIAVAVTWSLVCVGYVLYRQLRHKRRSPGSASSPGTTRAKKREDRESSPEKPAKKKRRRGRKRGTIRKTFPPD